MNYINISTDRNVYDPTSDVSGRLKEYAKLFSKMYTIVYTLKSHNLDNKSAPDQSLVATDSRWKTMYIFDAYRKAKKIYIQLGKEGEAVVSTQDPFETGIVGWLLKKRFGIRLHVQVHTDMYSPYFRKQSLLNRLRVAVAPFILKEADSIRVVSSRIKKSLIARGIESNRIHILPVFIDKDSFDEFQDVARQDSTLIAVSRLTEEKNLFFLVDVMNRVVNEKPDTKLVIVGDGPLRQELEAYVRKQSLVGNVRFVGWSSHITERFKEASVLLHTSLYEGYGRVFIEAALQRVPIVSSDVGIMGDVFIHPSSARVCPVGDMDCFVREVVDMLDDRSGAQYIAEKAHSRALEHMSMSKEEYLAEYKKIVCAY